MDQQMRTDLRRFLGALVGGDYPLTDGADAFTSGVVTSLHLLELITHVEDRYGVAVSQKDLFGGHFRSIDAMVSFVSARAAVQP